MQFVSVKYFVLNYKPQDLAFTSEFEGQIQVTVLCEGKARCFNPQHIAQLVNEMLGNCGDLMRFNVWSVNYPSITIRAEYYDVEAAEKAVTQLNGFKVSVSPFQLSGAGLRLIHSRRIYLLSRTMPQILPLLKNKACQWVKDPCL